MMKRSHYFPAAILGYGVLLFASLAYAQQMQAPSSGTPRISYLMPVAGQVGSTFELRVTGQDMNDVEGLHFNFPGVKVEPAGSQATPTQPGMGRKGAKGQPQALTTHAFKVTLPANAPLGIQDVRIITKSGISNPRAFVVSDTKEFLEQEPNDDVPKAQRVELNSSVSGVISTPTDVDYYVFAGKKGQRVVFSCLTSSIDSKLPVEIQVYSADGAYLKGNKGYHNSDAVHDAVLPADGDYYVRVFGFSYQVGGIDYFYRLSVSTAPWIDAVFPPVVQPGKDTQVTVYGRNLPGGKLDPMAILNDRSLEKAVVTIKAPSEPMALQRLAFSGFTAPPASMIDGFDFRLKNESGSSNPFLITYAPAPVILESGANREQDKAQTIPVPCVIAGRIDKKAERGWYSFVSAKGQVWNIEAFAERIGAPMDLFFQLRDDKGNLIVEQDDNPEVLSPQFFTRTDDPARYRFVTPSAGTYSLMVTSRDAYTLYGPRHLYTVRITPEQPDFRLVAMPLSLQAPEANTVNRGGGGAYNVYVWRLGGFNEDITLTGENLPPGVRIPVQRIGSGQKQAALVLHADDSAKDFAGAIKVVGTATVKGQKLTREVRSATISWPVIQANTPTITRLDRELALAVRDKAPFRLVLGSEKINVQQGEKISIPVKLLAGDTYKGNVQVSAIGGPPQLIPQTVSITPGQGGNVTLDVKGGNPVPPGNYTIFLRGQTNPINPKNNQPQPKGAPPNLVQISMPVSVTIVPKSLAKVSAIPQAAKVSVGKEVEVTVRVARLYELPTSFKVEAILPPNVKGLSAKDVTINADQDEAKLIFTAAPNAMVGSNANITVRFTAMFNDTIPVVHEAKMTLAVTK